MLKAFADQKYQDGKPGGLRQEKDFEYALSVLGRLQTRVAVALPLMEGHYKDEPLLSVLGCRKKDCPIKVKNPAVPKAAASKMVKGREEDGKKAAEQRCSGTSQETVTGGKALVGATKPTVNGSTAAGLERT